MSGHHVFHGEQAIAYTSTLERDYIVRTEFFLDVLDITPQPVEIQYLHNNVTRLYVPTFLVHRRLGNREYPRFPKPLLVEVAHREAWQRTWREARPRWKAGIQCATERGWRFRIQDETRVRDSVFRRIQWLARFKRTAVDEETSERILDDLDELGNATMSRLVGRHFSATTHIDGIRHIWTLLAQRQIDCDIRRPLNDATELWVSTNE